MKITILAFAQARDVFGFKEQIVTADDGVTAATILETLRPGWQKALAASRVAIDLEYAGLEQALRDGQTLAVIPPVSGG